MLGQEQDRPGSNFDANQAFVGQLYQLNMYGRALTGQEIERVFNRGRCASSDPNLLRDIVISWWVLCLGSIQSNNLIYRCTLHCQRRMN